MSSALKVHIRLKEERLRANMTQEEVGKIVGATSSAVGHWENGSRVPEIETLWKLADYFDCTVDYLIGRSDERNPSLFKNKPEKAGFLTRAADLGPEEWDKMVQLGELIFEVDKNKKELEKIKKRAKKDLDWPK